MQSHLQVNLAILVLQLLNNSQLEHNRKTSALSDWIKIGRGVVPLSLYRVKDDDLISNSLQHANMVRLYAPCMPFCLT